jgi:hypothetical protein
MPSSTHGDHLGMAGRPFLPSGDWSDLFAPDFNEGVERRLRRGDSGDGGGGGGGVDSLMAPCYDRPVSAVLAEHTPDMCHSLPHPPTVIFPIHPP